MMITLDENGNEIDYLEQRNEEIKEKLQPVLEEFMAEKEKNPYVRLGYRFSKQLYATFRTYRQLTAVQVVQMDYETLNDFWLKYLDLTAYYNRYFEVVDNKQLFCAYMGINDRILNQYANSADEDIRSLVATINSDNVGMGFTAAENGASSAAATKLRLGAKDVGHNVISASEEMTARAISGQTPQELQKEIAAITGAVVDIKKIK